MPETTFLDLMAFAKGAEQAHNANQVDLARQQLFEQTALNAARTQQVFDAQFPAFQAEQKLKTAQNTQVGNELAANQAVAAFSSKALTDVAALPPEQRGSALATAIQSQLAATNDPNQVASIRAFARQQGLKYGQEGNNAAFAALSALGGADVQNQIAAQGWQDGFNDPLRIGIAGGQYNNDGTVEYQGIKGIPQAVFAGLMRRKELDPNFNVLDTLAQYQQQQMQRDAAQQVFDERNRGAYSRGESLTYNPVTGVTSRDLLPAPPAVTAPYVDAGATRMPGQAVVTPAGVVAQQNATPPGQVQPGYPGQAAPAAQPQGLDPASLQLLQLLLQMQGVSQAPLFSPLLPGQIPSAPIPGNGVLRFQYPTGQ